MGRPERPLDPESGPLQLFACDLRQLRLDAGSPSYRELARKTQYSASVLSRAASGRELPSLAVTLAYAGACGGKAKDWQARWEALARQSQLSTAPPDAAADTRPQPASPRARSMLVTVWVLTVVTALAAGWLIARAGYRGPLPAGHPSPAVPAALVPPHDGADPVEVGCAAGAVTIAVAQLRAAEQVTAAGQSFGRDTVLGTVELRYSAHCKAAWAKVIPALTFDHPLSGREVVGDTRPADHADIAWSPGHVEEAYSDMLFTGDGCVSAYAVFEIADGHQASAQTPCRQGP